VTPWLTPIPLMATAAPPDRGVTPYKRADGGDGIRRLLQSCRKGRAARPLDRGAGDPDVSTGSPRGGRGSHRACGPSLTTHIFSGNVPGLPPSVDPRPAGEVRLPCKPASEEPFPPCLHVHRCGDASWQGLCHPALAGGNTSSSKRRSGVAAWWRRKRRGHREHSRGFRPRSVSWATATS